MDLLFDILRYLFIGFVGLIGLLVLLVIAFGKRIRKAWEYEARFRDADGREFGEFEIELSRIEKQEPDYTLKTRFRMRHEALKPHATVQVCIDDTLVFEEMVETDGRMYARSTPDNPVDEPATGRLCRVTVGGNEIAAAELRPG